MMLPPLPAPVPRRPSRPRRAAASPPRAPAALAPLLLLRRAALRRAITLAPVRLARFQEGLAEHVLDLQPLVFVRDRPFLLPRGQHRVRHRHDSTDDTH